MNQRKKGDGLRMNMRGSWLVNPFIYVAIATYGKDWKKVEEIVGTRSGSQVRSHAQKFFNKLLKEESQKKSG